MKSTFQPLHRVLVVDDSHDNRALVTACLRDEPLAVEQASDGRAALRLASGAPPDLIIIDVDLPLLDGLGVVRSLRARGLTTSEVRVIALTATIEADAFTNCIAAGCDDFIRKPLRDPSLLRSKVRKHLLALAHSRTQSTTVRPSIPVA